MITRDLDTFGSCNNYNPSHTLARISFEKGMSVGSGVGIASGFTVCDSPAEVCCQWRESPSSLRPPWRTPAAPEGICAGQKWKDNHRDILSYSEATDDSVQGWIKGWNDECSINVLWAQCSLQCIQIFNNLSFSQESTFFLFRQDALVPITTLSLFPSTHPSPLKPFAHSFSSWRMK